MKFFSHKHFEKCGRITVSSYTLECIYHNFLELEQKATNFRTSAFLRKWKAFHTEKNRHRFDALVSNIREKWFSLKKNEGTCRWTLGIMTSLHQTLIFTLKRNYFYFPINLWSETAQMLPNQIFHFLTLKSFFVKKCTSVGSARRESQKTGFKNLHVICGNVLQYCIRVQC